MLRRRWYSTGVVALLSGALTFSGVAPLALAAEAQPSPSATGAAPSPVDSGAGNEGGAPGAPAPSETPSVSAPVPSDEPSPNGDPSPSDEPAPVPSDEPTAVPAPSPSESVTAPQLRSLVAPLTVPAPSAGQAVITVKVGTDRTGTAGVTALAGVTLLLNTGGTSGPSGTRPDGVAGTGDGWAKCVSDVSGDCSFVVPTSGQGSQQGTRPWVVQAGVPTGYYSNPVLRVGGSSGAGSTLSYVFRLRAALQSGTTYSSLNSAQLMASTSDDVDASGGWWQQSRTNPTLSAQCGLDVALILDLSGSVGTDLPNLKAAADTFVNSLVGTPSRMSLFSFSWESPASGATQNYPTLVPLSTTAQANTFKQRYSGWSSDGGTNWDRGLALPAAANTASNRFDVAVVITDGNPTTFNEPDQGDGATNRFQETEAGIFSANALKKEGTRVIAFGVGAGASGTTTARNLRAISGEVAYSGSNPSTADYYQTTNYQAVGQALRALALGNCSGNLTVTKQIVPSAAPAGSIQGAAPAGAGWTFNAQSNTAGVTTPSPSATTTGDGTGTVGFPLAFTGGTTAGNLTVAEQQQTGYTLTQVGGANAVCTNLNTGSAVPVTNAGALGFTVNVPREAAVNCTVYNREPSPEADVTVAKKWVINGTAYNEGAQPSGFSAKLSLTGPGAAGATPQPWGQSRSGYTVGQSTTLSEAVTLPNPSLCTNVATVTEVNGAPATIPLGSGYALSLTTQKNTATVTNVVTCKATLTLKKIVDNTNGGPSSTDPWTLTGAGPQTISGVSGSPAVTGATVTPGGYALSESGPTAGYTASAWTCTGGTLTEGTVAVPSGGNVVCTITNTSKPGVASWTKTDASSALLGGSVWTLTGPGANGPSVQVTDCVQNPCAGPDTDPAPGRFVVAALKWGSYTLVEKTAPIGYLVDATPHPFTIDAANAGTTVVVGAFVNVPVVPPTLPLTGGIGRDAYVIGGFAVLAIGAAIFVIRRLRRTRRV